MKKKQSGAFAIFLHIFSFPGPATSKKVQKQNTTPTKIVRCVARPEYLKDESITLDPTIVDGVETLLMFIGYQRSGHTLISSLLDAHPNMVIANDYDIFKRWKSYAAKDKNKQYLFQELYRNSYREAHNGDRSLAKCTPKTNYKYVVPNQWQGNFNGKIKVSVL